MMSGGVAGPSHQTLPSIHQLTGTAAPTTSYNHAPQIHHNPNPNPTQGQTHLQNLPRSPQDVGRPPPQPRQPPPAPVQPHAQAQPPPPYNSPYSHSPTLPNVLPPQTLARKIPSPSTVLPSPAPSDGGGPPAAESASPLDIHAQPSPDAMFMEGVRQAAGARVGHKRLSDAPVQPQRVNTDKRMRQVAPYAAPAPANSHPLPSLQQPQYPSPNMIAPSHPPTPVLSHHAEIIDRRMSGNGNPVVPSQLPTPAPSHRAEIPSRRTSGNWNPHVPGNESSRQNRGALEQQWYSKDYCMRRVEAHRQKFMLADSFPWDEKRLGVVQKAVLEDDWTFLMTNQVYCVASWYREHLPPSLRDHPTLPHAVKFLNEILGSNSPLSQSALAFFAEFPLPIAGLASLYPKRYKEVELVVLNFFDRSFRWSTLKAECVNRGYPPLMRELVNDLGIVSPILQRIVFTSALRHIWESLKNPDSQLQERFEAQALGIMEANQRDFHVQPNAESAHVPEVEKMLRAQEKSKWGIPLYRWSQAHRVPPTRPPTTTTTPTTTPTTTTNAPPPQMNGQPSAPSGQIQHQNSRQQQLRQQLLLQQQQPRQLQEQQNRVVTTATTTATQRFSPTIHAQAISRPMSTVNAPRLSNHPGALRPRGRPRLHQNQPRPQSFSVSQQPAPHSRPLFPRAGHNLPQQRLPDPSRFALHQAYLRGATMHAQPAGTPLYQHVKDYLKEPLRLRDAGHKIEKWTFNVSREEMQAIPKNQETAPGAPPTRIVTGCMLRLRCVKWPSSTLPDEHKWTVADTSWIPNSYFVFNGEHLQQRKKLHHGKDMPIDLTPYVHEGENVLEIAINRRPDDNSYLDYLVAIEVLGFKSRADIVDECRNRRHISATESESHIRKKLSSSTPAGGDDDSDDEIAIVESSLSVSLVDPFSASKMCDIPVRGSACLHYDCFDLETFLQTRKLFGGNVSAPDTWKCPICNGDARPQHLVVDGFMERVRDELVSQGLPNTRAIILDQHARWKPKAEVLEGVAERDSPDRDAHAVMTADNVIDLSD
ncbi:hypothetical protein DM02DRAFT_618673 [Periconia macrospinosa]|uniref:SP-RING-type domain-containing protein n=1 Tax=Periconia macrospinosa TaxID=97972 RepID=A0A2V1D8I1_9PLEO|nr:hypothetical protein DM02DRAFT_618673 [Periconia macrospinosa]